MYKNGTSPFLRGREYTQDRWAHTNTYYNKKETSSKAYIYLFNIFFIHIFNFNAKRAYKVYTLYIIHIIMSLNSRQNEYIPDGEVWPGGMQKIFFCPQYIYATRPILAVCTISVDGDGCSRWG